MHRIIILCAQFIALSSASPVRAAVPSVKAIALQATELPSGYQLVAKMSQYVSPRGLNGNTVPYGLSVQRLKADGFRGAFSQDFMRRDGTDQFGEFWEYLAFAGAGGAHRAYLEWTRVQKPPFSRLIGSSRVGDECKVYTVPSISATMRALLCRAGSYVVLGHFGNERTLEGLMARVVARARHTRA